MKTIRCSSLPTWADCERRFVARSFRREVETAGFTLVSHPGSIGAPVGTGTHAAVAHSWQTLMLTGEWSSLADADAVGIASLQARLAEEEIAFDETTPDRNDAEHAVRKLLRSYRAHVPPGRRPELVEQHLRIRLAPDWELSGHTDLVARDGLFHDKDGILDDLKTGTQVPVVGEQLGAYDLAIEAVDVAPQRVTMTFCRRVRRTADQPSALVVPHDRGTIRRQARRAIDGVMTGLDAFLATADPFTFKANPASKLCSARFCCAFHTSWCPESRVRE